MRILFKFSIVAIVTVFTFGCKKLVQIAVPANSIVSSSVYENANTATAVLTGIYQQMSNGSFVCGDQGVNVETGLSADELTLFNINLNRLKTGLYENKLTASNPPEMWTNLYTYIFRANSAIEGLDKSTTLTSVTKNQLKGEAEFIRAYCYFNLTILYGDIPLVTNTDYTVNSGLGRTDRSIIYQQVVNDLTNAVNVLNEEYVNATDITASTTERVRPNKSTAIALLARVYLYEKKWQEAADKASAVISNNKYQLLQNLNDVFLKNSGEAIWQLQTVSKYYETADGFFFILDPNKTPSVFLSSQLVGAFEKDDLRKMSWIDSLQVSSSELLYPFKYKKSVLSGVEYQMVFRLAEQYLIRAEARAQLGELDGARSDLNAIRHRAGLGDTPASTQTEVLDAILHERQVELFTEGHRWFDLKRTGKINDVMSIVTPEKGGSWSPNWALYPIPQTDINRDPALAGHQNPGY